MDDRTFDRITRRFAGSTTRREWTAALLAAGGALLSLGQVNAKNKDCQALDGSCRKNGECCSGSCGPDHRSGRNTCIAEPTPKCEGIVCGELCCPAEAVGCSTVDVPRGPKISCQCPRGQEFIDGQCTAIECPAGTNCGSSVRCGNVSNDDFCCTHPQVAFCSCASPITGEEVAGCCTPGVDCPSDLGWDPYQYLEFGYVGPCLVDGVVICCCADEECAWGGSLARDCTGT